MITIYTDGASRGNPGPGGWGAIITSKDRVVEIGGRENHTTNNRMELMAAIKALESVPDKEVTVYADSEYVTKGMTEWIKRWQQKGWRTAGKKPVLNQDLWQRLLELAEGRNVEWKYVAGHSGIPLNERADVIATTFADLPAGRQAADGFLYNGPRDQYK